MRGAGGSRQAVVAVLATCALVALVALAALAGPSPVFEGEGPRPALGVTTSTSETPSETPDQDAEPQPPPARSTASRVGAVVAGALLTALVVLLVAGAALLVVRRVQALLARRPESRQRPAAGAVDVVAADRLADALREEAADQSRLLEEGTARNAVVQCWHRFEVLAARAGVPRHPWETSTEFTARSLRAVGADPVAVADLARLYREARFSDHPLGEDDRAAAARALATIRAGQVWGADR